MTARTDDVSQAAVDDSSFMLPASHAQARLWFLSQLGSRTGTYNLCFGLRMKGALDVAVFQRALSELVRRHESLRTRFEHQDEGIMQVVYPAAELPLERVDLSGFEELARTGALDRECEARISRAFDLEHDHLLRVTLFDLSRSEHFALLVVHHIVFDGWSMGVFSRELAELYRSFHAGQEPALEELELQYADYSDWHRQWLEEPAQRQQIDYWKKKLAGSLPVLQLPADRGRPAARTFQGVTAAYSLPGSLLSGLKARAQHEGAT
ncbi:MAG: condensation domain-containing protein, partial [Cystobacter sp.]